MSVRLSDAPRLLVQLAESDLEALLERAIARALHATPVSNTNGPASSLLSVAAAADALHCSQSKVRRLVTLGRLRAAKLGTGGSSRLRVTSASVEALIAESLT